MNIHKALHAKEDVDGLNVSRKEGGIELMCIKVCVDTSIQQLDDYIEKHGGLITVVRNETDNTMDIIRKTNRKEKWEDEQLDGRFK